MRFITADKAGGPSKLIGVFPRWFYDWRERTLRHPYANYPAYETRTEEMPGIDRVLGKKIIWKGRPIPEYKIKGWQMGAVYRPKAFMEPKAAGYPYYISERVRTQWLTIGDMLNEALGSVKRAQMQAASQPQDFTAAEVANLKHLQDALVAAMNEFREQAMSIPKNQLQIEKGASSRTFKGIM